MTATQEARLLLLGFKYTMPTFIHKCEQCSAEVKRRKHQPGSTGLCIKCYHTKLGRSTRKRPFESLYNRLLRFSRHEVLLSYEEFLTFTSITHCHYCDTNIPWHKYGSRTTPQGWNLDRKDSTRPYSINNVVVCCSRCNFMKGNYFSYEQFTRVARLLNISAGPAIQWDLIQTEWETEDVKCSIIGIYSPPE